MIPVTVVDNFFKDPDDDNNTLLPVARSSTSPL